MFRYNDRCNGSYINQFLKNVPIRPNTSYVLTFDSLGGAVGCWVNHSFAKPEQAVYYFDRCTHWTAHTVRFTTTDRLDKQANFENWGLAIFKKMNSRYITGAEDTYLDNVRLVAADEPQIDLLVGGEFEEPPEHPIYQKHWHPMFLGVGGREFGITIVQDPQNSDNHCLLLPRLIQPPVYPTPQPLEVLSFGYYKDLSPVDVRHRDTVGLPVHLLLFTERGEIVFPREEDIVVPPGHGILLPAETPSTFAFCQGKNTSYYWIACGGTEAVTLLQQAGIVPLQPFSLTDMGVLTAHVDELLQFPSDHPLYPYAASGCLQWCLAQLSLRTDTHEMTEQEQLIRRVAARLREQPKQPADNASLAESCGFSVGHFIRLFKQYMGCTPHQYHLQERMKRACALLRDTSMSVTEISLLLGIENPLYFSNLFRRVNGTSPTEYRQQNKVSV